jgi:iron complex transport system substrate-binding protein
MSSYLKKKCSLVLRLSLSIFICLVFFFYGSLPLFAETFTDEMGRSIELDSPPKRIISLAPHITEIVFDLGLGDKLVGVTQYSDYPEAAKKIDRVGSYVRLNIEKIISLEPDLVISTAGGNPREVVERLATLGLKVYVIHPKKMEDIYSNISSIAAITGRKEAGEKLAKGMKKRVDTIVNKVKGLVRPKVFLQLGASPLLTASENTFIDDLLKKAGGSNIASAEPARYPVYSMEEVINQGPDIIITMLMGSERDVAAKEYWEKWSIIPAVKNGRLFNIDPSLVNRPSPRLAEGLEIVARKLHPEAFNSER